MTVVIVVLQGGKRVRFGNTNGVGGNPCPSDDSTSRTGICENASAECRQPARRQDTDDLRGRVSSRAAYSRSEYWIG